MNFVNVMPNKISKHQVLPQLCIVQRGLGKSEEVEVQESLHAAGGPTGFGYKHRPRAEIAQSE